MHQASVGLDNLAHVGGVRRYARARREHGQRVSRHLQSHERRPLQRSRRVEPSDLGIKAFSYEPHRMNVDRDGGFSSRAPERRLRPHRHRYLPGQQRSHAGARRTISSAFGANVAYWSTYIETCARCGGQWDFNGQVTGLGLADFLLGRVATMEHGGPGGADPAQWYLGLYRPGLLARDEPADAQRRSSLGAVLRPADRTGSASASRSGAGTTSGSGVKSTQFVNAPPGFLYAGDSGLSARALGHATGSGGTSRRAPASAWDVTGDGRTAVRASYGLGVRLPGRRFPVPPDVGAAVRQPHARRFPAGGIRRSVRTSSAAIRIRLRRAATRFTRPAARSAS